MKPYDREVNEHVTISVQAVDSETVTGVVYFDDDEVDEVYFPDHTADGCPSLDDLAARLKPATSYNRAYDAVEGWTEGWGDA